MVGHVTAHGGGGVAQGASVLDVGAGDGIGVVAAPDLGGVLHHAQIVASAAAAAILDHGEGEQSAEPAEQLVDTAHMAEGGLLLTLGRQDIGVDGGEVAVHVPLEVVQGHVLEAGREGLGQVVHHGGVAHVQHQLLAGLQRHPPGGGQSPLGMGAVEIAVGIDHLGLNPDAEPYSLGLDSLHEGLQTVGEEGGMGIPVAQPRPIVAALTEPAVVHDGHIHAYLGGTRGEVLHELAVDVEVEGLPGIQHHGTALKGLGGEDVVTGEAVEIAGDLTDAVGGVGHDRLGGGEGLARLQPPGEGLVTQTDQHAGLLGGIHLQLVQKVTAVDDIEAVGLAPLLGGLGVAEEDAGVLHVGGGTAAAGDAVDAVGELVAVHVALAGVGTVGADEIQTVLGVGDIQAQAHALLQGDGSLALIDQGHVAGDDVGLGEDGVVEVELTARDLVVQDHFQSLGVLIRLGVGKLTVDGSVDGYAALVLLHPAEGELGGVAPRGEIAHTDGGGAEVSHAEGGELGGDGGGHVAVAVLGVVGGEGTAPGAVGQVGATGLFPVVQMDGKAIREDTQGVHGVLGADDGLGGDLGVLRVGDGDGHGGTPF